MELSKESIQEMKDILEEKKGEEVSWEKAEESARNLQAFANLLFDHWIEDQKRKRKLEQCPVGFCLDGIGYTCFICGNTTQKNENWYDKWGIKCLTCQRAIDKRIIPPSLAKRTNAWYSEYEIKDRFNMSHHVMRRFIQDGILKVRVVPNDLGKVHARLFLLKDNEGVLPPKKLTESQLVSE